MKAKTQKRRSVSVTNKKNKYVMKCSKLIDDPITEHEVRDAFKRAFYSKGF